MKKIIEIPDEEVERLKVEAVKNNKKIFQSTEALWL